MMSNPTILDPFQDLSEPTQQTWWLTAIWNTPSGVSMGAKAYACSRPEAPDRTSGDAAGAMR